MLLALQVAPPPLPLVPLPTSVRRGEGVLPIERGLVVVGGGQEGKTLAEQLRTDGLRVGKTGSRVVLRTVSGLPPEGYRLWVDRDAATIEASTPAGLFYGGQTLRQLATKSGIPAVAIEDAPRFGWRGMMLDVSRHFRPVADVERIIDLNARMKMNVFHWHLTDDGGWRMESKAYPELTRRGAWRSAPPKGNWGYGEAKFPEKRSGDEYGGFYTQQEIKEVVAFAAKRHVTIVPEIEMPGHEQAALQSLPWLACDGVPAGRQAVALCPAKESTYVFVRKILDETMALFPSKFIHVGGDEVDKRDWNRSALCQALMRKEGLKTADELQSYFMRRVDAYLTSKGRRLVGWDEILEGGLAPGATVMSWRGVTGGIAAAKQGRDVVMSPTSHLYLDYSYDTIPTEQVYAYDPIPSELTDEEAKHVLGAQGNVWTERLPEERDVERMAYPRAAALAEVVWTARDRKSWPDFSERLGLVALRWDALGLAYRIDPPAVPYTAYLTDGSIERVAPTAPPGWTMTVSTVGPPIARNADGTIVPDPVPLVSDFSYTFVRESDGATSPVTHVRVSEGGRRENVDGLRPGLALVAETGKFARVPMTLSGAPTTVSTLDLTHKPVPEGYALRFTGFVRLPKDGGYRFTLRSDDGSILKIGGLAIVEHDGEHAVSGKSGAVWAKAGVYPLELGYFDAGGANSLSVTVTPPDGVERPIPAEWFWHSEG